LGSAQTAQTGDSIGYRVSSGLATTWGEFMEDVEELWERDTPRCLGAERLRECWV